MPVKYITVEPRSDLFAPATRAFGDIAVVGKGGIGTDKSPAKDFSSPDEAAKAYPGGTTKLAVKAEVGKNTIVVPLAVSSVPPGTVLRIGAEADEEERTVTKVAAAAAPPNASELTLDQVLKRDHEAQASVRQRGTELERAIGIAFRQSPPPTKVWGVQVDFDTPQWAEAFRDEVAKLDVQIVTLANTPLNDGNRPAVEELAKHVAGPQGDGKERIGVAMLDRALTAEQAVRLNQQPVKNERMFLVAHKSDDDVAAAAAGVIAGQRPHISMLLKPISISMPDTFSESDIDKFVDGRINWITRPVLIPGGALYLGEGLTADSSGNKAYVDTVRTLDDVNFRIKASLIQGIGNLRVSRVGLRSVQTLVESVLSPLVLREVIEDFSVVIPLLTLFDRDESTLTPAERQQIKEARSSRVVPMSVVVVYAGAIHRLTIGLVFTG
ncbi:hypothetical protein ACQEV9_00965 [Streptomyces chartreusis]|uniref:hypothetical protein n=1 Tax=Streptomyces chartreusis TaxID=1969 RepID=UPI003D8F97EC